MCKYTTKYKDSWDNRKDYKCEEKDYTASGYCVFHYGLQGNDSQEINPAKVDEKKDDFETRLRKFLDINKDSVDTNKDTEYNCIGWVFPEIDFDKLKKGIGAIFEFTRPVNFIKTIFSGGADFTEVKFSREVSFRESQFLKKASFTEATFLQKADFRKSMFLEEAYFKYTLFSEDANFFRAKFSQKITLQGTIFLERADFARIHVGYALNFSDTFFFQQLLLAHASCKDNVIFDNCYAQYIDLEYCEVTLVCNIARSLIKNIVIKNAMFKSIMFRSVSPNIEYYKHQKNEQIEKGFEKIPELLEKKNEKLVVQSSKDEIQKTIENLKQEFNIRKSVTEDKDKIKNELKIIDDILQIQKKLKTLQELEELKTLSEEFKEFKEFKILSEEFKTIEEFKTLSKKFKTLSEEFKTIEEFKTLSKKF
ncbi:MAG: pentapeptide repeat-containing protein, partial [Chitinophagaceae bacterium]|nr:pentapeptide repeat-containing protein [Chitinophagaceae bacterium]